MNFSHIGDFNRKTPKIFILFLWLITSESEFDFSEVKLGLMTTHQIVWNEHSVIHNYFQKCLSFKILLKKIGKVLEVFSRQVNIKQEVWRLRIS